MNQSMSIRIHYQTYHDLFSIVFDCENDPKIPQTHNQTHNFNNNRKTKNVSNRLKPNTNKQMKRTKVFNEKKTTKINQNTITEKKYQLQEKKIIVLQKHNLDLFFDFEHWESLFAFACLVIFFYCSVYFKIKNK